MADVTKFKLVDEQRPAVINGRLYTIARRIAVVSGDCPQNDNIVMFDLPIGHQIVAAGIRHDATLGASATAQLRAGTTAITAASSAGAASAVQLNAVVPIDRAAEQAINILIAGAAITASANIDMWAVIVDMKTLG